MLGLTETRWKEMYGKFMEVLGEGHPGDGVITGGGYWGDERDSDGP
jgi:hypothetical protein